MSQHMTALAKANKHRLDRAKLHREVAALSRVEGMERLAELIEEPPAEIVTLPLGDALVWVRLIGSSNARQTLRTVGIGHAVPLGALVPAQRARLARWLRREPPSGAAA